MYVGRIEQGGDVIVDDEVLIGFVVGVLWWGVVLFGVDDVRVGGVVEELGGLGEGGVVELRWVELLLLLLLLYRLLFQLVIMTHLPNRRTRLTLLLFLLLFLRTTIRIHILRRLLTQLIILYILLIHEQRLRQWRRY